MRDTMTGREREEVWGIKGSKKEMEVWKGHPRDGRRMSGEWKERRREGKSGSSYVVWEAQQQPTLFTTQMLNVSFCKARCMFLVFPLYSLKHSRDLREKMLKEGSWIKGPEQNFKPSTSKVNDMHLIPMSPNKAVREWFHTHISGGLS